MKRIGMHQCVVIYDDAIIINYCKITIIYCLKQVYNYLLVSFSHKMTFCIVSININTILRAPALD